MARLGADPGECRALLPINAQCTPRRKKSFPPRRISIGREHRSVNNGTSCHEEKCWRKKTASAALRRVCEPNWDLHEIHHRLGVI